MSVRVGSQRKTSGMLRSWWTNSIAATQGNHDSGVRDQIGVLSLSLFVCDRMWSSTNGLGTGFTTFGSQSSGGGVSPCTISAVR